MQQAFISYATKDNIPLRKENLGWVSHLYETLTREMTRLAYTDDEFKIWFDESEIKSYEEFSKKILGDLSKSNIFIAVLTYNYIEREWTKLELTKYTEKFGTPDSLSRVDRERFIKVFPLKFDIKDSPPPLDQTGGYDFWEDGDIGQPEIEYYHSGVGVPRDQYWFTLTRLARDLIGKLKQLREDNNGAPPDSGPQGTSDENGADPPGDASGQVAAQFGVFVAKSSSDMSDRRAELEGEVSRAPAKILRPGPDLFDLPADQLEEKLRETAATAQLSVHMLGKSAGFTPEGTDRSITALQLAAAQSAKTRRIIWAPMMERDARQNAIVQDLRNGVTSKASDEFFQGGFHEFRSYVRGEVDRLSSRSQTPTGDETGSDEALRQLAALPPHVLEQLVKDLKQ